MKYILLGSAIIGLVAVTGYWMMTSQACEPIRLLGSLFVPSNSDTE